MSIPPRDDPQRPVYLAVWIMTVFGILTLLPAFLALLLLVVDILVVANRANFRVAGGVVFYGVVGTTWLLCAFNLPKRRLWALIVPLVLASLQTLLALWLCLISLRAGAPVVIPAVIAALILAPSCFLVVLLRRSFAAIKIQNPHGFEPLNVRPRAAEPVEEGGADGAAAQR